MRSWRLMSFFLLLFMANSTWGGLYNTSEPEEEKRSDPSIDPRDAFAKVFRETLLQLRSIGIPKVPIDNPLRKRYLLQVALAARVNPANLTTEQKLNLSAAFIRGKKFDDAINLLSPLVRQEPKNFLVLANLATAFQLAGQESRAIDTLEQALSVWPAQMGEVEEPFRVFLQSIGWHEARFDLYRKAETYQLKLLKLRMREGLTKRDSKVPFESVDALFDDGKKPPNPVRFVGESGKFEPGKLAAAEKTKLPKDAIDIVQQLLIWLPEDVRLYWLLGELYNAEGGPKNIRNARMIFDELAGYNGLGVRAPELAEHYKELRTLPEEDRDRNFQDLNKLVDENVQKQKEQAPRIDWQTIGVAFGTGILVAIFGMWQINEIRRRRQNRGGR